MGSSGKAFDVTKSTLGEARVERKMRKGGMPSSDFAEAVA